MQITKSTENRKNLTTAVLVAAALMPLAALSCRSGPPRGAERGGDGARPAPLVGDVVVVESGLRIHATLAMGGVAVPGTSGTAGGARRPPGGGGPMGGPPGSGSKGGAPMEADGGGGGGGIRGGGPSHALSVSFTNSGARTVEFTIVDVKSRLGNFLPQPDTLALAPGQQGALYPMRGTLPDDIGELELTVTIRMQDGRSEMRLIHLKPAAMAGPAGGP